MTGARIISWTPSVVTRPIQSAAAAAFVELLGAAKGMEPKGAGTTLSPRRSSPSYTTKVLRSTGWGTILVPGAKPHSEDAAGSSGFSKTTGTYSKRGKTRSRRSGASKGGLFWPGAAHPVGHVDHPGIAGNPYIEAAAALFPKLFASAAAARLP